MKHALRLHRWLGASALAALVAMPGTSNGAGSRHTCVVRAHVSDPDPNGTNLRAGPSPSAAVKEHIPHEQRIGEDSVFPELEIIGFEAGWAKVRAIRFADYGQGETILFRGPGWISGRLLSGTAKTVLRYEPSITGRSVVGGPTGDELESSPVKSIDDCNGTFAHVSIKRPDGRLISGWTDGICNNQVTTCN